MKTRLSLAAVEGISIAIFCLLPMLARAQDRQPGTSKIDLSGPAPRLPNGKPSMSGVWGQIWRPDVTDSHLPGYVKELPFTEWGKQQWESYDEANGDYTGNCLPFGLSRTLHGRNPIQIIQDNDFLVFLAEQDTWFHVVPTDGRPHDPNLPPTWFGESIGHWEGDTLVIDTRNINGYVKVDTIGHPLSNQARLINTFRRIDYGHAEHTYTVDDPKSYTRPWTITETWNLKPGIRIMEYSCEEGSHFEHLKPWHPPQN